MLLYFYEFENSPILFEILYIGILKEFRELVYMAIQYRVKKKKRSVGDTKVTLDAQHKNKLDEIENQKKNLKKMKNEMKKLVKERDKLSNSDSKFGILNPEKGSVIFTLNKKISELKQQIKDIESGKNKEEYYSKAAHILYNYYDNIKSVSTRHLVEEKKSIIDFFNKKPTKQSNGTKITDFVKVSENSKRANLLEQYTQVVNPNSYCPSQHYVKTEIDICPRCEMEMSLNQSEGLVVCPQCGREETIIIDSEKPSYKDPPPEAGEFTYKRMNRLDEWITQYQAKETTEIPEEVLDKILMEIKKDRIDDLSKLSMAKVRNYLKKLGLNKYYEHVPHIIYCLNGLPTPRLSQETEEKLRSMFRQIQDIFDQVCPPDRTNFLSYSYLLRKLLELLGEDEHKMYFRLHKSREKIYQHDKVWQKICKLLNWQFIRTI